MAEQETQPTAEPAEKVWTQSEHDAYVKARIDKQNAKHAESMAAKDEQIKTLQQEKESAESELAKIKSTMEFDKARAKVAKEYGLPVDILRGKDEKELREHAESIKNNVRLYPSTKDGGEKNPAKPTNEKEFVKALFGKE